MSVKVKAYAKINLMLDIISTRKDGYHDLFMIMQSINLYDTVTISETKSKKITITCNIDDIPLDEKNIAYKAADAFFKANKIKNKGINIDIVKRIPHQAGLAGGRTRLCWCRHGCRWRGFLFAVRVPLMGCPV